MPYKDLHSEPFNDSTIAKLEIFEDYAQAWIPTFVMQSREQIHIFDFFAGTGYDKTGVKGSPIRILDKLKGQIGNIFTKGTKVVVHFNEFQPNKSKQEKFELLQESCREYLAENNDVKRAITLKLYNSPCEELFPKLLRLIEDYPSLVYLDQNGIKFLSDSYLLSLEKCQETDFLYFVSSSYFWRFGDHDAFKMHLNIDLEEAKKDPYKFIHKSVIKQLKRKLPQNTKLRLYPYTLEKGANIHGIIFGASHPRAVDKFLSIAWKRNELNGEANFDIYNDRKPSQMNLFGEKKSKIEIFQDNVANHVLEGLIKNNHELFQFTLDNGHIGNHSAKTMRKLKKDGKVEYEGKSPLVTYDNVHKKKRLVNYQVITNESK